VGEGRNRNEGGGMGKKVVVAEEMSRLKGKRICGMERDARLSLLREAE
jgi:hypothetical protein